MEGGECRSRQRHRLRDPLSLGVVLAGRSAHKQVEGNSALAQRPPSLGALLYLVARYARKPYEWTAHRVGDCDRMHWFRPVDDVDRIPHSLHFGHSWREPARVKPKLRFTLGWHKVCGGTSYG